MVWLISHRTIIPHFPLICSWSPKEFLPVWSQYVTTFLEIFLYFKWFIGLLIQNLILNTVMSFVDHFIDGFLRLTDYRRLKIGQIFPFLKIFFFEYGPFFFFLSLELNSSTTVKQQYYFCCFCSGVTFGHETCMTLAPQPVTETAPPALESEVSSTDSPARSWSWLMFISTEHLTTISCELKWWNMHQRIYWKLFWLVKKNVWSILVKG